MPGRVAEHQPDARAPRLVAYHACVIHCPLSFSVHAWIRTPTCRSSTPISISGTWSTTAIPGCRMSPPIPFRYGDYTALRRNYLPADFRRDCGAHRVVKTVYVEAEWDPQDPVGETRWVSALAAAHGLPNAIVAQAWLDRADVAEVLAAQAAFRAGARRAPQAARRGRRRRRWCRARRARWAMRAGAPATHCSSVTACISSCRRRGGIWRKRWTWHARFRARASC